MIVVKDWQDFKKIEQKRFTIQSINLYPRLNCTLETGNTIGIQPIIDIVFLERPSVYLVPIKISCISYDDSELEAHET